MLNCTPAAAKHICRKLSDTPAAVGLRITAQKTNRSGLAYRFEPCLALGDSDLVVPTGGGNLIVSNDTAPFVAGATLDFAGYFTFAPAQPLAKCGRSLMAA